MLVAASLRRACGGACLYGERPALERAVLLAVCRSCYGFISERRRLVVGVYGKNLLGTVAFGSDTQFPPALGGGTFSPLAPGRIFGLELTCNFVGI